MLLYFLIIVDILALAAAQLMLKKGVMLLGEINLSWVSLWSLILSFFKNFYILGGLLLLGIGFTFWLFILSKINLNIIYPISASLTIILVSTASYFLFRESLGLTHIIGIIAIVFGIFLILYR